ncbi:MAG TPA: hypothetical protein VFF05_08715, partial [Rudaea sp.]|nr:hypothetical protein [Rudaea sp.]
ICSPATQHYIYVGSGPSCQTTSIQTAIGSIACPDTSIVVSTALGETYTGQHITLNNVSANIVGSADQCDAPPVVCDPEIGCGGGGPPPKIAIGGDGANPVFYVSGGGYVGFANLSISGGKGADNSLSGGGGIGVFGTATAVTLRNVELHDNTGGNGGGIAFYGDGSLTLDGTTIQHNSVTGAGGGLSVDSSAIGHIDVTIADDPNLATDIHDNTATVMGGGISVSGNVHLLAASANALIRNNHAGEFGGGIAVGGGTLADLGLAGNAISGNLSDFAGGGIVVVPNTSGSPVVRLFNRDGSNPLNVQYNKAAQSAGGLYLYPGNASLHATACLFDVDFTANHVLSEGSAILVGDYGRLRVNPTSDAECDPSAVMALGAKPNAYGGSHLYANVGIDGSNQVTNAAVIDADGSNAQVSVQRLNLVQNSGGYAIHARNAAGSSLAFSQCLLEQNYTLHEAVNLQGTAAGFDGCTFARNNINGSSVFAFDTGLSLTRSIVAEDGALQVWSPTSAPGLTAHYLALSGPNLSTDATVIYADPVFVDPDSGDFHLQITSPAADYAPNGNEAGNTDLDGRPREVDKANAVNRFGPRDLGAYEISPACFQFDTVSCNGFESTQ